MRSIDRPSATDRPNDGTDACGVEHRIDWDRLDRQGRGGADGFEIDRRDAEDAGPRAAADGMGDAPLIERSEGGLDPELVRAELHDVYPSRFTAERAADEVALSEARERSDDPAQWVPLVNVRWIDDATSNRTEHTTNCADCSRAVQRTFEGDPRVACGLDPRGLGFADDVVEPGEQAAYTERWAGRRAEDTTYEEIGDRLRGTDKSAIVFGQGQDGGHAFNALTHDGTVLYADGQTGEVSDWAPAFIHEQFPMLRAIFFERNPDSTGDAR